MIFLITFLFQSSFAASPNTGTGTAASFNTNTVEFEPTVIEGAGHFSGVTAVHVKNDVGGLYSKKMDFTAKIQDSLSEMADLPVAKSGENK